jgi:SM-20-related protein
MTQIQNHFELIADGLADSGYAVIDDFLSSTEVEQIKSLPAFSSGSFRKAGIGKESKQVNEAIRGDSILWLDKEIVEPPLKNYLTKIDELRTFINQSLYLSLKDFEAHLASYPAGSFYKRHLDQFKSDDHRKISIITYLNDSWKENEGGQLRMYHENREIDILPLAGRMVCFRSDQIEHEVLPATRERLSITGWLLDQFSDLRHLK